MTEQIKRTTRGIILYDDELLSHASPDSFRPEHWQQQGALGSVAGGRGSTVGIKTATGDWVLRHYRRGGWVARLSRDAYLWTGLERSRPWREWRLLASMHAEGLPVPRPVAAQVQRWGLLYRGDLITSRITDARTLAELLTSGGDIPWSAVGACLARFHQAGIYHADLNAHNILLGAGARVYLIDFDKGCRRIPGAWRQANLRRLQRSLHKLAPSGAPLASWWQALTGSYKIS